MKKLITPILFLIYFVSNSQELKTYSGDMRDAILDNGKATYTYYEKNGEMIRHGKFSYTWSDVQVISVRDKKINVTLKKTINGNYKDGLKNGQWNYSVKYIDYALNHAHAGDWQVSSNSTYSTGSISMTTSYKSGEPHGDWSYKQNFKTRYTIPIGSYTWKWSSGYSTISNIDIKASFNNGVLSGIFDYKDPYKKESAKFTMNEIGFLIGEGKYENLGSVSTLSFKDNILVKEIQRNMSTSEMKVKKDYTEKLKDPSFEYTKSKNDLARYIDGKLDYFRSDQYFNYKSLLGKQELIGGDKFRNQEVKGAYFFDLIKCTSFAKSKSTGFRQASAGHWLKNSQSKFNDDYDNYASAKKYFSQKEYSKSIENYKKIKSFLEADDCSVCEEELKKHLAEADSMIAELSAWIEYEQFMHHINNGDNKLKNNNFDEAIKFYNQALKMMPMDPTAKLKIEQAKNAKTIYLKEQKVEQLIKDIYTLYNEFKPNFDETNKYPNGKILYEKAEVLLTDIHDNKFKKTENLDDKIKYGDEVVEILKKLNSLNSTDTKELNKQLKKAENITSIKVALGL